MLYLQAELEAKIGLWKLCIVAQKSAIESNDDTNPDRKALNMSALSSLDAIVNDIDTWFEIPVSSPSGRFTDTSLAQIISNKDLRVSSEVPARLNSILSNLGTVTQASDGKTSGEGAYFDLFEFVKLRISKSGGTLYSWYGMALAVKHFETKIAGANKQLMEYKNLFTISLLTINTEVGDDTIAVEDATLFSINDVVSVFDDESVVTEYAILSIFENDITLNNGVSAILDNGKTARIVRRN